MIEVWVLGTGYWVLGAGCWVLGTGCNLQPFVIFRVTHKLLSCICLSKIT